MAPSGYRKCQKRYPQFRQRWGKYSRKPHMASRKDLVWEGRVL
jgi:hypothetical protein